MRKSIYFLIIHILIATSLSGVPSIPLRPYTPESKTKRFTQPKKSLTFMVFMSADNDLYYFAIHNLKQMLQVGSNENINIIVQLNTPGRNTPTQRLYIEKNNALLLSPLSGEPARKNDSGSPQALVDFVRWAQKDFPAEHYALILWDHATGALDPGPYRTINTKDLFFKKGDSYQPDIDTSIKFISVITQELINSNKKAVCFDDTFQTCITNQGLHFALKEISTNILRKPIDIIGFDACLMSMVEIAAICKEHAHILVGSEEIEYGNGWNYQKILSIFNNKNPDPTAFARHMVEAYHHEYSPIASDYTQSAIQLSLADNLEDNVNAVARLIIRLFNEQRSKNIKNLIKLCKSPHYCTCFDEPSYIDLGHFYKNLLKYLPHTQLNNKQEGDRLLAEIYEEVKHGLKLIGEIIIHNVAGKGLSGAQGISIYFPEYRISGSYLQSHFGTNSDWIQLLKNYIKHQ